MNPIGFNDYEWSNDNSSLLGYALVGVVGTGILVVIALLMNQLRAVVGSLSITSSALLPVCVGIFALMFVLTVSYNYYKWNTWWSTVLYAGYNVSCWFILFWVSLLPIAWFVGFPLEQYAVLFAPIGAFAVLALSVSNTIGFIVKRRIEGVLEVLERELDSSKYEVEQQVWSNILVYRKTDKGRSGLKFSLYPRSIKTIEDSMHDGGVSVVSSEESAEYVRDRLDEAYDVLVKECEECGDEFSQLEHNIERDYCSMECEYDYK